MTCKDLADRKPAPHAPPPVADHKLLAGPDHELEGETNADGEDQQPEQQPQLLAADVLAGPCAELRADDAADHQDQRQHRIDQVVGDRMQQSRDAMVTSVSTMEVPITVEVGTRKR